MIFQPWLTLALSFAITIPTINADGLGCYSFSRTVNGAYNNPYADPTFLYNAQDGSNFTTCVYTDYCTLADEYTPTNCTDASSIHKVQANGVNFAGSNEDACKYLGSYITALNVVSTLICCSESSCNSPAVLYGDFELYISPPSVECYVSSDPFDDFQNHIARSVAIQKIDRYSGRPFKSCVTFGYSYLTNGNYQKSNFNGISSNYIYALAQIERNNLKQCFADRCNSPYYQTPSSQPSIACYSFGHTQGEANRINPVLQSSDGIANFTTCTYIDYCIMSTQNLNPVNCSTPGSMHYTIAHGGIQNSIQVELDSAAYFGGFNVTDAVTIVCTHNGCNDPSQLDPLYNDFPSSLSCYYYSQIYQSQYNRTTPVLQTSQGLFNFTTCVYRTFCLADGNDTMVNCSTDGYHYTVAYGDKDSASTIQAATDAYTQSVNVTDSVIFLCSINGCNDPSQLDQMFNSTQTGISINLFLNDFIDASSTSTQSAYATSNVTLSNMDTSAVSIADTPVSVYVDSINNVELHIGTNITYMYPSASNSPILIAFDPSTAPVLSNIKSNDSIAVVVDASQLFQYGPVGSPSQYQGFQSAPDFDPSQFMSGSAIFGLNVTLDSTATSTYATTTTTFPSLTATTSNIPKVTNEPGSKSGSNYARVELGMVVSLGLLMLL